MTPLHHLPRGETCPRPLRRLAAFGLLAAAAGAAMAEEGGSGHYFAGSISSFVDATPASPAFIVRQQVVHYDGSANIRIPIAGEIVADAHANSWAYGLTFVWRPEWEPGPGWSYAMSATIPYVTLDVAANADPAPLAASVRREQRDTALGDVVLIPLMLRRQFDPDFGMDFRLAFYAPTGSFQTGRLANTGKNFWTVEPTLGFLYFGQKNGIEASLYLGADFNQENPDTNYKTGTQVHADGTLAQHFPALGGTMGLGISAYYYRQVTGDSGDGATLGQFKGKSVGVGPVASYIGKVGEHDIVGEFKWLHETDTVNRLKGDTLWLKVVVKF